MTAFETTLESLRTRPRRWLVTGAAGFIGSHLVQSLLEHGQRVVGLDDFSTGHRRNIDDVLQLVPGAMSRFEFIEGDIRDLDTCRSAAAGADFILHQAALGSVPRSINDPITSNAANVSGFLNMLVASRDTGAMRFVYAASSSTYGDHPGLPKVEQAIGRPLSPYAVTKLVNELYAEVFQRTYGMNSIGLRYFNVFGPRQDPNGAYAAVIPRWIGRLLNGEACEINGDGETSRDFCYISNVVQANILAATTPTQDAVNQIYNVAVGDRTTLQELFDLIRDALGRELRTRLPDPIKRDFRPGDVRHSQADITKASSLLGYQPTHTVREGIAETVGWFVNDQVPLRAAVAAQ